MDENKTTLIEQAETLEDQVTEKADLIPTTDIYEDEAEPSTGLSTALIVGGVLAAGGLICKGVTGDNPIKAIKKWKINKKRERENKKVLAEFMDESIKNKIIPGYKYDDDSEVIDGDVKDVEEDKKEK